MGGAASAAKYSPDSSKMVLDTLKKLPFMQMMDDRLLQELAECFQVAKYAKGALIKNDAASRFFVVVAEGSVDISTMLPKASSGQLVSELLCQRKTGDYISYVARDQLVAQMMGDDSDDAPRTAKEARKKLAALLELNKTTADPFVGCTLLKLNFDKFSKLRSRLTVHAVGMKNTARFSGGRKGKGGMGAMTAPEKLHLMGSIVESEVVNYLVEIPFLERVEMTRLVMLANMCSYLFVRRGESVCVEGEIGDRFFVCIKGSLQATLQVSLNAAQPTFTALTPERGPGRRTSIVALQENAAGAFGDKKIQALKRMGTGSYFGEISLVFKIPRVCSITALDDALLVYVDRTAFCNFLKVAPDAAVVLLEHVRLNFMDTLIKQGCSFLNAIPPLKLQELSYMSEIVDYEFDSMIMRRGDRNTAFYVLLRGVVEIDYGSTDTIVEAENEDGTSDDANDKGSGLVLVHPGGYFGQEALLLNCGSLVNVRCLDHCLVLKLMPENFHEFFSTLPELFAEFCIKCLRERAHPDHIMQHYEGHKLWAADCVTRLQHHEVALFEYIEDFKWEADISEDRLHERALVIYLKFLAETATTPVNISPGVLAAIEDELSSDGVGRDVFAAVREEILENMDDEAFHAFKASRVFQEFLTVLHCPRAVYESLTPEMEAMLSMRSPPPLAARRFTAHRGEHSPKSSLPPPKRAFGSALSGLGTDRFRRNSATVFAVANSMGTIDDDMFAPLAAHSRRKTKGGGGTSRKLSTSFVF
ncbi:Dicarboxylate/amino acid:cation (Na or H) symporter (DAACS) family protein [Phytophthora cinnamomi]|uniref:Dicarboxylate/amino acid:cation (Na or H) symporter (DAACS) family protein n=1 Tax=Phytophthora cinnamomi TaxID=4785 RepID=UPI00355A251B|nr:Dicarboxylate/amino acid:cation (Na or H) symporter (DAACS) family protein [Phytophthora cinnamomi]